ncbi:MAG: hypothetical protein ACT4NY_13005 [Pseudonocardiales bacterium]
MPRQVIRPRVPVRRRSPAEHLRRRRTVLVPLTCAVDGRSHCVTEHAFAAGRRHGYYRVLCGRTVVAAAMVCPDGPPCPSCAQHARELGKPVDRAARHRRPGPLRRLVAPLRRRVLGRCRELVRGVAA